MLLCIKKNSPISNTIDLVTIPKPIENRFGHLKLMHNTINMNIRTDFSLLSVNHYNFLPYMPHICSLFTKKVIRSNFFLIK